MEVSGQLHTPPLYPWGKSPRYLLDKRLGGPQSQQQAISKNIPVITLNYFGKIL
jgi:hypothetical protein